MFKFYSFFLLLLMTTLHVFSQNKNVEWIEFEQLEDSLNTKQKKIFIFFYTDWCSYCKKMENAAFKNQKVISLLKRDYYPVKFNSEYKGEIIFEGRKYVNKEIGKKRNSNHQIPLMLASRKDYAFSLPAIIILNESFEVTKRYFEYLSPKKMIKILE